jgi:hypothetical protein
MRGDGTITAVPEEFAGSVARIGARAQTAACPKNGRPFHTELRCRQRLPKPHCISSDNLGRSSGSSRLGATPH